MKRILSLTLIIALATSLSSCTNPDRTVRVLEDAGYTNIVPGGYAWFSCSEDDTFATRFTATGPSGRDVSGAVCAGFLKGATIRLD